MKYEYIIIYIVIVWVLSLFTGCLPEINVNIVSERTALENQVLGTYNAIDREMLLVASVRGVDSSGKIKSPPKHSQEHKDAITAMQVLDFNADDLSLFKRLGWAGENFLGLITSFEMNKADVPEELKDVASRFTKDEFENIIKQINESRNVVMHRVIELNENLTEKDLPKIQRVFGKLNIENALPGEKIQLADSKWVNKKGD